MVLLWRRLKDEKQMTSPLVSSSNLDNIKKTSNIRTLVKQTFTRIRNRTKESLLAKKNMQRQQKIYHLSLWNTRGSENLI